MTPRKPRPSAADAWREVPADVRCAACGKPAECMGRYEGHGNVEPACNDCCGHGNEDGFCQPLAALREAAKGKRRADEGGAMTREERDELLDLACKATDVPWRTGRKVGRTIYDDIAERGGKLIGVMDTREDAAYVVAAVNALPGLLDEVDRLRAALTAVGCCSPLIGECPGNGDMCIRCAALEVKP